MEKFNKIAGRISSLCEAAYFGWGVLVAKWSPMLMAAGYWIEEALMFVVTAVALFYIWRKKGSRVFMGRYLFVYGFFLFVHTVFFLVLAAITSKADRVSDAFIDAFFDWITGSSINLPSEISSSLAVTFLVILAVVIYAVVYRVKSTNGDPSVLINRSFGAVIAPHFLIIFGAGGILLTGAPYALAVVLVAVKLLIDVTGFGDRGSAIVADDEVQR